MEEYIGKSCTEFTEALSSGSATPGGGSTSALVGALGVSLGSMVGNLTIGRKAYAEIESEMIDLCEKTENLRIRLLSLVQRDIDAFNALMSSYRLPKNTEEEKALRSSAILEATKAATEVPLAVMDTCAEAFPLLLIFVEKGNPNAISDSACGAIFCKAAIDAAVFNVYINVKTMKDADYVEKHLSHAEEVQKRCGILAEEVVSLSRQRLG